MSLHKKLSALNFEVVKEALFAAEMLIGYTKNTQSEIWDGNDNGCLGYPAAILLFAYIESVGCIYMDKEGENSFLVLRHPIFDNQKISELACKSIYKIYRSRLMHNLALPKNAHLHVDYENAEAFCIVNAGQKRQEVVSSINLFGLLNICKCSFDKIKDSHEKNSEASRIMNYISNDDLSETKSIFTSIITPSGNCTSDF